MYIDIYFPSELPVDRDDLEDALDELDGFEVVGAGVGVSGSNLDVEVDASIPRAQAIEAIVTVLRQHRSRGTYLRLSDTGERVNAAQPSR
ncbi:hypothetical protein [Dactylosporangium sp. NPDC005555]|uniref:hypothetical protein n=1 Tax=Dactylosporangium sp. NPDC005555 TaxID=3154889 RepID=UPI0033AB3CDF